MYGPAARRKRFRRSVGCGSCVNVSGLTLERVVLRATMDISAHAISLASRPRPGHQGHQCSHAPGRPILHLVSSSRRPRRVMGFEVTSSIAPQSCAVPLFVPCGRSFVPTCACAWAPRARSRQGWPSRLAYRLRGIARPHLDRPERSTILTPVGAPSYPSQHIRSCAPC